ncbi:MAG: MarR family transcriptional regulator [Oscillospiraceae bacterium]|nr:MarR family transcriptional regulator [Oscillospiraceae bacterium]MBO5918800.1 MarR family transcriptional regulator [Oscillospiraceae bacterium]
MSLTTRRINILSRCQNLFRSARLKDTGLTAPYYNYVLPICRTPGLSQEQLARRVYFDKYNVTRHLARLEQDGYVQRLPSQDDKRVMLVYPTEKMLGLLPEVRRSITDWDEYLFDSLSPEELAQFDAILEKITQRAQEYVDSKDVVDG